MPCYNNLYYLPAPFRVVVVPGNCTSLILLIVTCSFLFLAKHICLLRVIVNEPHQSFRISFQRVELEEEN